jgi:hypothetical protein
VGYAIIWFRDNAREAVLLRLPRPGTLVIIAPATRPAVEFFMPKAYAVVTYRSICDPEKLAAYAKLAGPAIAPFGPVSSLAATQQLPVNRGLDNAP